MRIRENPVHIGRIRCIDITLLGVVVKDNRIKVRINSISRINGVRKKIIIGRIIIIKEITGIIISARNIFISGRLIAIVI